MKLLFTFLFYSILIGGAHLNARKLSVRDTLSGKKLCRKLDRELSSKPVSFENFHVVDKGKLYRSAQLTAKRLEEIIKEYGIKTVINLRGEIPGQTWWLKEKEVTTRLGVEFVTIPIRFSGLPRKDHIRALLDAYEKVSRPILIHCGRGAHRTGEAAALWVLDQMNGSKEQAHDQLSVRFGFDHNAFSPKLLFIELWQGRQWAMTEYDPRNYSR